MEGFSQNAKMTRVLNSTAAGVTTVTSSVIDMQGFEGVEFTTLFGAITAGAVIGVKLQQGNASDGSDAQDLAGTNIVVPATASNVVSITDLWKPTKRYVRIAVTRTTQNSAIDGIIAQQYEARVYPSVNDTTTVAGYKYLVSPIEGTA